MLLLRRITLVMRAGHSSAANTAVSLEPRHVGMWSRSGSRLGQQNCKGGYAACSNHEFGDASMTLDERQLAATIETWPPIISAVKSVSEQTGRSMASRFQHKETRMKSIRQPSRIPTRPF